MPTLANSILLAGAAVAVLLIAALIAGLKWPAWRVWPAPPVGSLRSFAFWALFRTLNAAVFALAALRGVEASGFSNFQIAALLISAVFGVCYALTLWSLGRKATYCQASGLETTGLYRWTRNPQYASAIAAIGFLAVGVARLDAIALSAALIAVYVLMAHAEEPWLRQRYGAAYDAYAKRVPRMFSARLMAGVAARELSAARRSMTLKPALKRASGRGAIPPPPSPGSRPIA